MSGTPQAPQPPSQMEPAIKHTYMCMSDDWISEQCEVSIAPNAFARGGMRKCHRCFEKMQDGASVYSIESVAKFSMIHRNASSAKAAAFADAKMQMVAEYWAQQFNQRSPPEHKVAFVVAQVLELPSRPDGPQRWASLEPLLSGEYAKFNNNAGAVLGGRTAQAFSHFTVHESSNQICICDLQGVGGSLFTDPQIHAVAGSFGDGNLGRGGIERFLASHRCNEVCAACKLPAVEPRARSGGSGAGAGMPMGGFGGGVGGLDIGGLMQGGMAGGAGMSVGMHKLLDRLMGQMRAGGPGGNMRMFVNGREVEPRQALRDGRGGRQLQGGIDAHGGRGAGGGAGGGADACVRRMPMQERGQRAGGADQGAELRAALRASDQAAAAEDEKRLREALRASTEDRQPSGVPQRLHPPAEPHQRGADLDLQRAIEASVQRPQQQQAYQRRR